MSRTLGLLLALALLGLVVVLSVAVGAENVPLGTVWHALLGGRTDYHSKIVLDLRLPRTLVGLAAGVALGLAGTLMQALTRNPLADPGILGVNSGAACAVVCAIALLGVDSPLGYVWFSFAGAAVASLVVYALGLRGANSGPVRLALAGTAVSAVLSGLTSTILVRDAATLEVVRLWQVGSLAGRDIGLLAQLLPFLLAGAVLAVLLAGPLNAIALGDELGAALGARVGLTRVLCGVAVVLLCGAATAVAGPIGFVGLVVPHAVRMLAGANLRWVLPYSMVVAPILLITADIAGRLVARPDELEVGVVTAFLGAPLFIVLVRRYRTVRR
ncbi:FecCD family ABC transporter permease [Goodfellowiella coeruleoviolacea]|uniref:Iron complex transport system permease protein n=1 Tax=Goodfellowiella coeruleoviolacea TaxID=334858 RepID=A0AAE3GBS4_9PSEU|nr:iron chelate uptake ABC transporter family permease subunit [Goodfellowiella coeruleoviolacea]MCP2163258.1 iron complex transport system permease protein [Goodfellowiella coeruleoviolacea]